MKKLRIGDLVKVIAGKYKGQQGKLLKFVNSDRVIIEGIAMQSKFVKKGFLGNGQPGQIVKKEGSIHISNIMVVCPVCGKPSRIQIVTKDGKRFRQCKRCKALIDIEAKPETRKELRDKKEDKSKI